MDEARYNADYDQSLLPPLLDEFSYFCKFDQLSDIPCNSGGKQRPLKESRYISISTFSLEDGLK